MVLAGCPPTLQGWLSRPWLRPWYWPRSSTCLTSLPQFSFGESSANRPPPPHTQHCAAGSLPGKRRVLLITCQTIDTSAQTGRREVQAQMLGESYRRPDQILRKDNRAHDYRLCEHAPHISLIRKFNNSLSPSSSDLRAKHSAQTLAGLVTANCVSDPASQSFFSNL